MKFTRRLWILLLIFFSMAAAALQSLEDGLQKSKLILNMVSQNYSNPGFLKCHEQSAIRDPELIFDQAFQCEESLDDVTIIHDIAFKVRKGEVVESTLKLDIPTESIQKARANSEKLLDSKDVEVFRNSASGNDTYKVPWFEINSRKYQIYYFPRFALVTAQLNEKKDSPKSK